MISLEKLILMVVAIVAGVLLAAWLFGEEGSFSKAQSAVKEVVRTIISAINPSIGAKEVQAQDIIPEQHQREIQSFVQAVGRLKDSAKQDCFTGFSGFSDFGEQGTVMQLQQQGNNVVMNVFGSGGVRRDTDHEITFEDMQLCVIAGENEYNAEIPEVFTRKFLHAEYEFDKKTNTFNQRGMVGAYFRRVSSLVIAYDAPFFGSNANRIDYGEGFVDFSDTALFTPDNTHICFFPLSSDGLDEDGLGKEPDISPPREFPGIGLQKRFVELC